jgi:tRNA A37 threonylcarbamoyladenosine biosynthesis protein TsaE
MICEWSEHGGGLLPQDSIVVRIERVAGEEEKRIITIKEPL